MISNMTAAVLRDIIRRESRSLLQYVHDSYPWATSEEEAAQVELRTLIDEEIEATAALSALLQRHHLRLPYLGAFPDYTSFNFVALDHLLRHLVAEQCRTLAALERDVAVLLDPEAQLPVEKLVEMKRRHLKTLETLAARHPETVKA
jgi:hypothetical protein